MARHSSGSLVETMDQMHASASRSTGLTTFDDLTAPPVLPSASDAKGIDLVQGGFSSLYSRIKASVGGTKDSAVEPTEGAFVGGAKGKPAPWNNAHLSRSSTGTTVSSPVVVSVPSSRLQSPVVNQFPDAQLPPPSRDSTASSSAISNKPSVNGSKSSLTTRPSISPSMDSAKVPMDNTSIIISPMNSSTKIPHTAHPFSSAERAPSLYSHAQNEPFRQQRGDMDLQEEESDTTEDDMVMVDRGGFANDNARYAFQLDPPDEGLTSVKSRGESHYDSSSSNLKSPRGHSDNGSDATEVPHITNTAQTPVLAPAPQRPPMVHVGPSHLPGYRPSRASSSDGVSSIVTSTTVRSPAIPPIDELKQQGPGKPIQFHKLPPTAVSQMRRKIVDREFWMRDENAKDCFNCGDSFSTFRRKHHCRTCGQIFDSKCTSLIPGKTFGQSGSLRICKPCEGILYGNDDDSSVYTDEGDQASIYEEDERAHNADKGDVDPSESDHTKIGTPTISIPMSRKAGSEKKRRSAVIEMAPTLARPSSSRSLRSLSGRPRSSSHKRHHSRHQHMRNVKYDDRAPFHQQGNEGARSRPTLPAFHHDNIIDPDLAPFMSDEDTSEDEQASIFAALRGDSPTHPSMDSERGGIGGLIMAMRKGKSRTGDRSVINGANGRDADNVSVSSRHVNRYSRKRNLSVGSLAHARPSPRRSKSNSILRTIGAGFGAAGPTLPSPTPSPQPPLGMPSGGSKITRSASMLGDKAPPNELNQASRQHVDKLLKQMLQDAAIPHASSWEKALKPILLKCTEDVNPDVQRNDDMDIRHYIKLKKIPGARPKDTSYVSGVVFTKNVAKKDMPRSIPNPRIVIVTFAIEYARHQTHFMSLEPVIAQEREYLRNLVNRIAALGPHVLLVQRNVSGLALEFLEKAGIVVAYNIKPTVLNAVARCTQSPMLSSVDKLAIDPSHLGRCDSFDVKTFVNGRSRKTYIYLSGCDPELGCTIVLRGDETETLRRLKRIAEFMCYVVYNLKLETCLMRDEYVLIPAASDGGTLARTQKKEERTATQPDGAPILTGTVAVNLPGDGEADRSQNAPGELEIPDDAPAPSFYSEMVEEHRTTILSASPFVKFAQPYLLNQAREYERKLGILKKLRDQYTNEENEKVEDAPQKFELVQPQMVHNVVKQASGQVREFLHAVHAAEYDKALHNYQTQKRQWEAFLSGNRNLFDPFNHQKIATLYSVVNTTTSTPCIGPEIIAMGFYHEHEYDDGFTPDCTLGQYVEDLCHSAPVLCDVDGCNRRMLDHHRQYVHGQAQMSVHVLKMPPKMKDMQNTILMWSCCRICGQETQVIPMSHSTWKYSFAKYLELTFWSSELHPRANLCPHDIHRDYLRYFGLNNVALRMQYDSVPLYEVTVPRPVITWKVDGDLKLKNEQFTTIDIRLDKFMTSVRARLNSIRVESVIPDKVEICRAEVDKLTRRANEEHEWLKRKLQDKYMNSKYYEIIPLNRAIRAIQEKAIAWDDTFTYFEQEFFPSEKDIRRLATLQLKKIFLERDESTSSLTSVEEGAEPGAEEPAFNERSPYPLTSMPSTMSPEHARDMLTSVVQEDQSHGPEQHDSQSEKSKEVESNHSSSPSHSQELPIQTPIEALQREDVRHLDLAVPSNFPEIPAPKDEQLLKTPTLSPDSSLLLEPGSPTPTVQPKVNPIDQSVAEAIDNMSASPTPAPIAASNVLESKIPRPVDTVRRDNTPRPSAMIRTQSQPGGVPKLLSHQSTSSSINAGTLSGNSEIPKLSLTESARALEKRMSERLVLGSFKQTKASSMIPRSVPVRRQKEPTKVSALAKHFEQLSREFEKERKKERAHQQKANRQARAYPVASSKPVVEVYKDVHEAVHGSSPSDEDAHASPARISTDNSTLGDSTLTETTAGAATETSSPVEERHPQERQDTPTEEHPSNTSHPASDVDTETSDVETAAEDIALPDSIAGSHLLDSQLEGSLELPKHEKTTLMKMLTSFWSERSASGWATLEYPLGQNEHVWEDSDIIVREDEPSSIIALALSSPDYLVKLQSFRDDPTVSEKSVGGLEVSEASIERNLLHEANTNIRYGFTNRGVRAQCKIFYAQSFDALRRKCGVADRFVESLSRCSKWDSKGGKSKSIFLKTMDERFVLKSLSAIEVNAFFRFAPNYFAFTHQNLFKGLPSVIAKMFGLFQVQIRTPSGRDFDCFMLVMENLFYEREPNRRYDLKGSMRNRKIESTGDRDEVLLDENLVDIIYSETPIFVREHTKKLLKASVWNDTLFLQQQNVMDYSLMAGFHDETREIIVGIIDCIRTYTWDKKLESWIKDRGKNKPTITSPKDYRNRFRMAMEKYILQAPNCWHQFSGRMVGVGPQRRTVMLPAGAGLKGGPSSGGGGQVLEVEGGEEEKAAGSRI